jgi:uncharacterized membrane protein YwaF
VVQALVLYLVLLPHLVVVVVVHFQPKQGRRVVLVVVLALIHLAVALVLLDKDLQVAIVHQLLIKMVLVAAVLVRLEQ